MKTIGLLGGMSWESSVEYERIINQEVRRRLGGTHSASLLIRSYDFHEIEALQQAGRWDEAGDLLAADAVALEKAGAEVIVLCTNTMHRVADEIASSISVAFVHIADATAVAVRAAGVRRVALLGTEYTMEQEFYRGRLERHGLEVLVPDAHDRRYVHDVIFNELVRGVVNPGSKAGYIRIIDALVAGGAGGVIAGCTEIELLVGADDVDVAYFPTARIHALAVVEEAFT